nr:MAG TPA: hypothetical protein [Caudoviricetes sp.]
MILGPRRRFYLASCLRTCRFYVRCALFLISCSVSYTYILLMFISDANIHIKFIVILNI